MAFNMLRMTLASILLMNIALVATEVLTVLIFGRQILICVPTASMVGNLALTCRPQISF